MSRLVIASNNPGKLREFAALLSPLGIEPVAQGALGIGEAEEPHETFIENALAKARHASAASGLPALADDSGLCAVALGGAPGVHSARYAGEPKSDARNNEKLIAALQGRPREVYYYCALVLLRHASDPRPLVAEAAWHGEFIDVPRGTGGFGYDPHFLLPAWNRTAAELDPADKNRISHRGRALALLMDKLRVEPLPGALPGKA